MLNASTIDASCVDASVSAARARSISAVLQYATSQVSNTRRSLLSSNSRSDAGTESVATNVPTTRCRNRAMLAAGFSAGEVDQLRRAMAAWKRKGGLEPYHERLVSGMLERSYDREFAESIFAQIKGFGEYGFPESHAASFALLVYSSAWLRRHEPAVFLAALLNSQPMGFYTPSQLLQDARRRGLTCCPSTST